MRAVDSSIGTKLLIGATGLGLVLYLLTHIAGNVLVLLGLLWSFLHHFCMGIRILLLDIHVGIDKVAAHKSSIAVMAVSLALTAILGGKLLGIY